MLFTPVLWWWLLRPSRMVHALLVLVLPVPVCHNMSGGGNEKQYGAGQGRGTLRKLARGERPLQRRAGRAITTLTSRPAHSLTPKFLPTPHHTGHSVLLALGQGLQPAMEGGGGEVAAGASNQVCTVHPPRSLSSSHSLAAHAEGRRSSRAGWVEEPKHDGSCPEDALSFSFSQRLIPSLPPTLPTLPLVPRVHARQRHRRGHLPEPLSSPRHLQGPPSKPGE